MTNELTISEFVYELMQIKVFDFPSMILYFHFWCVVN